MGRQQRINGQRIRFAKRLGGDGTRRNRDRAGSVACARGRGSKSVKTCRVTEAPSRNATRAVGPGGPYCIWLTTLSPCDRVTNSIGEARHDPATDLDIVALADEPGRNIGIDLEDDPDSAARMSPTWAWAWAWAWRLGRCGWGAAEVRPDGGGLSRSRSASCAPCSGSSWIAAPCESAAASRAIGERIGSEVSGPVPRAAGGLPFSAAARRCITGAAAAAAWTGGLWVAGVRMAGLWALASGWLAALTSRLQIGPHPHGAGRGHPGTTVSTTFTAVSIKTLLPMCSSEAARHATNADDANPNRAKCHCPG